MSSSYTTTEEVHYHVRSISLPSRLQHPSSHKIEKELKKLKTWDAPQGSNSLQTEAIKAGLTGLAELYNCVHELIGCPLTQQALLHQSHHLEKPLDMSVQLLDICESTRELLSLMKEQVLDLQSALRRKGIDSSINSQVCAYISFRKKARKDMTKSLKASKTMESSILKSFSYSLLEVDHHLLMVINVLRESSIITISFFRKLLHYMCGKSTSGWSMFSRMVSNNEMGVTDIALCSLHGLIRKNDAKVDIQIVKRRLGEVDGSITELEAGLDCLFRCLIKHRVSLLNLLTSRF